MTHLLNPGTIRLRLLVLVAILAAFELPLAPPMGAQTTTPPPTTWTITIKINGSKLKYLANPPASSSKCVDSGYTSTDENLWVCPGDAVYWRVGTKQEQGLDHSEMYVIHQDAILPQPGFHASDGATDGGVVTSNSTFLHKGHKYCVGVLDRDTGTQYSDDPKIMIGGSQEGDLVNKIDHDCSKTAKSADPKLAAACDDIEKLEGYLGIQLDRKKKNQ